MKITCDKCGSCTDRCPLKIAIPQYLELYEKDEQGVLTESRAEYERISQSYGRASDCIRCGRCDQVCKKHLPIIAYLEDIAEIFE